MARVAGTINVAPDGSYTAVPALGPFGIPAKATSLAQAYFEQRLPHVLSRVSSSSLAMVVDPTTEPPTTVKANMMRLLAEEAEAMAFAVVEYMGAGK